MADKIKGKGVISGIAIGNILLAGQNLDSFLVSYKPGKLDTEKKKAADALVKVAANLVKTIEDLNKKDMKEQAAILEAHRMMVEDPAMSAAIDEQVDVSGSAVNSVVECRHLRVVTVVRPLETDKPSVGLGPYLAGAYLDKPCDTFGVDAGTLRLFVDAEEPLFAGVEAMQARVVGLKPDIAEAVFVNEVDTVGRKVGVVART